ncbi:uncharacterized protein LOC18446883 isoform X1 [Amborella trichopoda]|uniref:uncharacterized protein LOC18446883 isoform X1 n=1 Tax=Amborella trichopoda TaxID=13333 RepID=UPI0009BFF9BA|nr:uncharacterized protein LOC18446883 isoform X1 [Amborella trichopoda]|eukprot:XP_020530930.1 uncharacterized protein LOC18446883 isoform X1 [Amborella trichopoda]
MEELRAILKEGLSLNYEEEEIYETIQAPKWVDLRMADRFQPDDNAWFCLQVGCNQKHEEVLDPAALRKAFILRVMAARSPNKPLRKTRNQGSPCVKSPLSAPAKSVKDRTPGKSKSRLFPRILESESSKHETATKLDLVSNNCSTPDIKKNPRHDHTKSKALTTPRYKKSSAEPQPFHSAQTRKGTGINTVKTGKVAKVLVFPSPRKPIKKRHSLKDVTPIETEMKKLEISSGAKNVSGHFCKSSRCASNDAYYSRPTPVPVKSLLSTCKEPGASLRLTKKKVPRSLQKCNRYLDMKSLSPINERKPYQKDNKNATKEDHIEQVGEGGNGYSSDMEIDGNSRKGSMEEASSSSIASREGELNRHEEDQETEKEGRSASIPETESEPHKENLGPIAEDSEPSSLSELLQVVLKDVLPIGSTVLGSNSYLLESSITDEKMTSPNSVNKNAERLGEPDAHNLKENNISDCHVGSDLSLNDKHHVPSDDTQVTKNPIQISENNTLAPMDNNQVRESHSHITNKPLIPLDDSQVRENPNRFPKEKTAKQSSGNSALDSEKENDDKENTSDSANNSNKLNSYTFCSEEKMGIQADCGNTQKMANCLQVKASSGNLATVYGAKYKKPKPTNPKPFRLRTDERGILKEANQERRLHLLATLKETNSQEGKKHEVHQQMQRDDKNHQQHGPCRSDNSNLGDNQTKTEPRVHKERLGSTQCYGSEKCTENKMALNTPIRRKKSDGNKDEVSETKQKQAVKLLRSPQPVKPQRRTPSSNPKEPNLHRTHMPKTFIRKPAREVS